MKKKEYKRLMEEYQCLIEQKSYNKSFVNQSRLEEVKEEIRRTFDRWLFHLHKMMFEDIRDHSYSTYQEERLREITFLVEHEISLDKVNYMEAYAEPHLILMLSWPTVIFISIIVLGIAIYVLDSV